MLELHIYNQIIKDQEYRFFCKQITCLYLNEVKNKVQVRIDKILKVLILQQHNNENYELKDWRRLSKSNLGIIKGSRKVQESEELQKNKL